MRIKVLIFIYILLVSSQLRGQGNDYPVSWDYKGQTFNEFVIKTESTYPLKFFFKEEWINNIVLQDYGDSLSVSQILDKIFIGLDIYYLINKYGDIFLTRGFSIKVLGSLPSDEQNFLPAEVLSDNPDTQQQSENLFIDIGNPAEQYMPGNANIFGFVRTENSKAPIAGVTVFNRKLSIGTITNEFGFYSLPMPRGSHSIQYSFIGMKEKKINVNLYGDGEIDVDMTNVLIPLKEAIVSAQKNKTIQRFEVGLENISIVNVKLLPTSLGESDIIKSVLFVPGVKVVGEGSSGFNVRGGSSDQNLILLYGAPLYSSTHFFGFFSAVNSDIIKDISLYKGGIPARYGGRISSVLNIVPREGNRKEFSGNAGISPVTTHLTIEAPIIKDKCSFILAGRSTYSNWIFDLIQNPVLQNSLASFYDINGRISYDIDRNNKLEFSSYLSHDGFRLNSDTLYRYNSNILSIKWKHFFTARFFSEFDISRSSFNYDISSDRVLLDGFNLIHEVNSSGLKANFNWYPEGRSEFNFGSELTRYSIVPGKYLPSNDSSLVIPELIQEENAFEAEAYIDAKYNLTTVLSVNVGLRFSSFFALGPAEINIYDPSLPKSQSTVESSFRVPSNHVIKTYAGPEYRISLNLKFSDNSSFKINYNKTRQYLHLLTNTTAISPTDTWKLCDYYLKPQIGDQFALGFYRMLYKNNIETSVELYFKTIKNMIDFKGGAQLLMNENTETEIVNAKGRAYGLELMIKSTEGRLRWSAGYTYSRIFIRSLSNFDEDLINSGEWFPANFDKPQDLVATFNFLISRRFSVSASYTYNTGRPITYPFGAYEIGGVTIPVYSERNKYRIPDYSRLDLSMKLSGNLKLHKIVHPYWTFSVYNILGRQNVYSIYFKEELNRIKGYKLSVFGKAIPSVTYSFDF